MLEAPESALWRPVNEGWYSPLSRVGLKLLWLDPRLRGGGAGGIPVELICVGNVVCLLIKELERLRVGGTGGLVLEVNESSEKVLELGVGTNDTPEVVLEAERP